MGEDLTVTATEEKSDGWGHHMVLLIPRQHTGLGPTVGTEQWGTGDPQVKEFNTRRFEHYVPMHMGHSACLWHVKHTLGNTEITQVCRSSLNTGHLGHKSFLGAAQWLDKSSNDKPERMPSRTHPNPTGSWGCLWVRCFMHLLRGNKTCTKKRKRHGTSFRWFMFLRTPALPNSWNTQTHVICRHAACLSFYGSAYNLLSVSVPCDERRFLLPSHCWWCQFTKLGGSWFSKLSATFAEQSSLFSLFGGYKYGDHRNS